MPPPPPPPPPPNLLLYCLVPFLFFCYSRPFAFSASIISRLPGFPGPLPFHLETGYVGVDEALDVQLFYYFIESEGSPEKDPLLLWLTGGPGCSAFSGLAFEIGPLTFELSEYNGSLPTLILNPYSWTKVSNIIFLDSPVGSGFSYSRSLKGNEVGDISSSKQVYKFMRQWLIDHPQFQSNPFYVAGDSYAGKVIPVIAQEISEGIEGGHKPLLNLKGYLIGNPVTGEIIDYNARIPYAYGVGIISKELYELTSQHCEGQAYDDPISAKCAKHLGAVKNFLSDIQMSHILEPKCPRASPRPKNMVGHLRSLKTTQEFLIPPPLPKLRCRSYPYYLSYFWANNNATRKALHIRKGTVEEWQRCNMHLPDDYVNDVPSSIKYQLSLTSRGYRALVYSGDHDMLIPFLGTEAWIKSLNFSIVYERRSWSVDGQIAGYTRTYSNNLTFATVKGAGHTAPEYRPKECLAMVHRWLSHDPL